jgi:tetratricopeptide (TPR) repeat protein
MALLNEAPAESTTMRENALYNSAVIYSNLENYKEAVRVLDKAVELYPKNKELLSLSGQTKYQSDDAAGAVVVLEEGIGDRPRRPDRAPVPLPLVHEAEEAGRVGRGIHDVQGT